jgi:predicted PurR-regulated permease PerM
MRGLDGPRPAHAPARPASLRPGAILALEFLLVVAALVVLGYVAVRLRLVVIPVIVAIFLSVFLVPLARVLRDRGVPGTVATLLSMLSAVVLLGGTVALLAPTVIDELAILGDRLTEGVDEIAGFLASGPLGLEGVNIESATERARTTLQEYQQQITRGVVTGAVLVVEVVTGLLLALVLLFFFVNDGDGIWRWVVRQFPQRRHEGVDQVGRRGWQIIGGYLRGVALVALVDATLIGLALLVLGVPLVLPLVVLTFLGAFFPLIGAVVAGFVAAAVTLVTVGPVAAIIVVVVILAVQEIEGDVLYPLVVGRAINLHPVAILLLLTAGGVTAGIIGALFAIPLGAVAWEVVKYLRLGRVDPPPDARPARTTYTRRLRRLVAGAVSR